MNERDELLKKYTDKIESDFEETSKPYKATKNMNVALNNPSMNVDNINDININNNGGIDNSMSVNDLVGIPTVSTEEVKPVETPIINNVLKKEVVKDNLVEQVKMAPAIPVNEQDEEAKLDVTERAYVKQPIKDLEVNKTTTYVSNIAPASKKKKTITVSKDVQIILVIILILFIAIMIIPTISDFFRNLNK